MIAAKPLSLVLGFKPTSHGFGWAAFESPLAIHDWGLSEMKRERNAGCLRKLRKLLDRLEPHTIVLEAFEPPFAKRSRRIVGLCHDVIALAHGRGMDVAVYSRGQVQACFASVGARSRQEIAEAVARSVDLLRDRVPPARRLWQGPHRKMAIFDAAALVLAHYRYGAENLFSDLLEEGRK